MYWPKEPIAVKAPAWMPVGPCGRAHHWSPYPKGEPGTGCPSPVGVLLGRAGEVAPARREDPSVRERYAVLQHQLAEAAEIAQACADAEPAYLQVAAGGAPFVYLAPGDARAHP